MNIFKKNKKEEVIKDYGKIIVPTKWEDITLKQFQLIQSYYNDKEDSNMSVKEIIDIAHILLNITKEEVNELPLDFLETIIIHLQFLMEEFDTTPKNEIIINNEKYSINYKNKLKVGEYVDAQSLISNDNLNIAAILAIMCRKDDEIYDDKFISEQLNDRIKMYEESPVTDVYPIITFFLSLWSQLKTCSPESLMEVGQELNQSAMYIESLVKDMVSRKPSLIWQIIKLRRLRKSIKNILQQ